MDARKVRIEKKWPNLITWIIQIIVATERCPDACTYKCCGVCVAFGRCVVLVCVCVGERVLFAHYRSLQHIEG